MCHLPGSDNLQCFTSQLLAVVLFCVTEQVFDVFQAGANMIVSGSAIMKSADPRSVINLLRNVCSEAAQKRSLDR